MLNNTAYRLHHEKKLTVGFFGGSITEGTGASDWDKTSWRANIVRYLRATYPDAQITEVNAAIGGTGSDLGLYRCERDLLRYRPNLVFVEFAVNDFALPYEEQLACYENCLRQILLQDKTTEVVCVFTATKATERQLLTLGDYRSRTAQTILARHYGLDMVNLGDYLRSAVAAKGGDWLFYTTDTTHPNDEGYLVYTEAMKAALTRLLVEIPEAVCEKKLPAPYVDEKKLSVGKIVELSALLPMDGWHFVDQRFKKRFPHYVCADGIGSELQVTFEGENFGVYLIMDDESGILTFTLDGKETKTVCAWDDYCKSFSRAGYHFPFVHLEKGTHTITIRVSDEKARESRGNKIAIYGFLIS